MPDGPTLIRWLCADGNICAQLLWMTPRAPPEAVAAACKDRRQRPTPTIPRQLAWAAFGSALSMQNLLWTSGHPAA